MGGSASSRRGLARRAAPLPESTRARPPLESGQRPVGAGRWLPRLLSAAWWGRQKGRPVPRSAGGRRTRAFRPSLRSTGRPSPVHHRRSVSESAASPLDSTGSHLRLRPNLTREAPRRRRARSHAACRRPAPPVRDSRSADGDRRPAVCPSVASTRRCLTENPAPACYPDHATRTNAAGTRAKLKIQMETK